MSAVEAPVFHALIAPHRSLTRKAAGIVVLGMMVLSCGIALRFLLLGAWPVVALSLLDAPLLVLLLIINQRRAQASELILLHTNELTIIRTDPAGRQTRDTLPAAWLRVELMTGRSIPRLILSSHGRHCEIGAFLHEPDKICLFDALRDGLHKVKNRRFDNLQLRDGWYPEPEDQHSQWTFRSTH